MLLSSGVAATPRRGLPAASAGGRARRARRRRDRAAAHAACQPDRCAAAAPLGAGKLSALRIAIRPVNRTWLAAYPEVEGRQGAGVARLAVRQRTGHASEAAGARRLRGVVCHAAAARRQLPVGERDGSRRHSGTATHGAAVRGAGGAAPWQRLPELEVISRA